MISAAALARMRAKQEASMAETCVWVQVARRQLDNGRWVESTPTTQTGAARIGSLGNSAVEKEIAGRLGGRVLYVVAVPYAWDVQPKDRLQIGTREFEAAAVITHTYATARRVVCSEVV